jgi:hypothetical protein
MKKYSRKNVIKPSNLFETIVFDSRIGGYDDSSSPNPIPMRVAPRSRSERIEEALAAESEIGDAIKILNQNLVVCILQGLIADTSPPRS